jgi:hypothetical protein
MLLASCCDMSPTREIDNCFALSVWAKNYPIQTNEVQGCLTSSRACVNACQAYSSSCTSYSEMVVSYCTSLPEYKSSH